MYCRLFLLAAVLLCGCSGESSVRGPSETVLVLAGRDVILPCTFNITAGNDFPTVEWSKEGLQPNVIFLYRDGCETYEMKNPAFEYRTSLITKELKNRNISLRISNVQLSGAGRYQCMRLWTNAPRDITTVELVVGAVSEPKLSVVSAESGAVTVQCEADCWLPEPQIQFLDDRGHDIPAEDTKRHLDAGGCYAVTRRATLQEATHSRVTCRVHQAEINQTRDTQVLVPGDYMRSSCHITCIAVGVTAFLLLALCKLTVVLWKRCGKREGQKLPASRQSSDQSTLSSSSSSTENQPFLKTDNERNAAVEKLTREVADLKSKLLKKEEIIRKLQNNVKSQLSPVVCQHGQPTIVYSPSKCSPDVLKSFSPSSDPGPEARNFPNDPNPTPTTSTNSNPPKFGILPQIQGPKPGMLRQNSDPAPGRPFHKKRRVKSSPAGLNIAPASGSSSASTSQKKLGSIGRSMSESCAQPGPNGRKYQRRHSSMLPGSALSINRFRGLAELTEESEQLVR